MRIVCFIASSKQTMNISTTTPAKSPGRGAWYVHGMYLPDDVLKKIYRENAMKVLKISWTMNMKPITPYNEIKTQTQAWAQALDVVRASSLPKAGDYDQVIFTGCGSTYYLSFSAAAIYQELTGRSARAVPGGELLLNSQTVLTNQKTLLVAISRSGTTTETVKAVEKFKAEKRGDVVVISNYDEVLSRMADLNICDR
jgi:glucosamine 6-phosphate synthetase-like amidotransferase/phosphosugar isomerase protein